MLKNKTILIPFTLPWNWSADYQKQTCLELAKNNQVIAYFPDKAYFFLKQFDSFKIKHSNIQTEIPKYYLPFRRFVFIEKINQIISIKILKKKLPRNTILWVFDPIFHAYPQQLKSKISLSLYDCVDYHNLINKKKEYCQIRTQENKLLNNVDLVFVNSTTLKNIHHKHQPHLVPQGFNKNIFTKPTRKKFDLPSDKPLIGFIGSINYRLDFKLLNSLIKNNPKWNFIFVGPIQYTSSANKIDLQKQIKRLQQYPNSIWKKNIEKKYIPSLIKKFDVAMIPYDINYQFNQYCYPMKLFEYFYLGKPVVSTPIKELQLAQFKNLVRIGKTAQGWKNHIEDLLSEPWPKKLQQQQQKLSMQNSWKNKISTISNILNSNYP